MCRHCPVKYNKARSYMHSSNTQTNLNMNTDPTLRKSIFYFTCKSVFLHLVPSELVWWPSRFRSCTSNSRSNRSHLSSGRWCHSVDISWPPHSVTGSVSTYRVQREVATSRNAQLLRQLTLNKTCSTKKKKKMQCKMLDGDFKLTKQQHSTVR